jgi:hypothetical protein
MRRERMSLKEHWRKIFPRRPRGLERIRRLKMDLAVVKKYAAVLPEEGKLSLFDRFFIWLRPFLKNINPKEP